MQLQSLDLKAKAWKMVTCLMTFVMFSLLWIWQPGLAGATNQSNDDYPAAQQIEVWVGYSGDQSINYTSLKTFQTSELEKMQVQYLYTFIDNMPCTVVDPAVGVKLTDILAACEINVDDVKNFRFWTSDVPGNPYETLTKLFLLDTPRYYFPHIADNWETVESSYYDPIAGYSGDNEIYFPDPVAAAADAVEVPAMLAFKDNWQRVFSGGTGDTSFSNLVDATRFRLLFGHPVDLASEHPIHTASKAAKWVYRMDVTLNGTSPSAVTGVTLDKTTDTIRVGFTDQLTATITPSTADDLSLTWSSSDTAVATVSDNGLVTGVSAGSATITVTTTSGGKTATCDVTVKTARGGGGGGSSSGGGDVTGVTLNKTTDTISAGSTVQLTATVTPSTADNLSMTWSSSDTTVATVSGNGLVTGVSAGSATITVTTTSGGKTAICVVTVQAATAAATGITLNKATDTISVGSTDQLTATITPSTADQNINWSSSDTVVATVSGNGLVTGVAPGVANITATTVDGGFTATCAVTVAIKSVPVVQTPPVALQDISGHWAENNVKKMVDLGVISGYLDGTFIPDNTITRAEFAVMLEKAFKLAPLDGKVFADITGHWAQKYIATTNAYGIVNGYDDSSFGPDDPITREQMAVMIVKAAKLSPAAGETGAQFADSSSISDWAVASVTIATKNGIMKGYPDNTFQPQGSATRAEAVTAIINALNRAETLTAILNALNQ